MIQILKDKLENLLKICSFKNIKGSNGQLQEIQIQTLRNIEDALKVGQFGFNSKAPLESRAIVARLGNENIVIANEHVASIVDISSGNTVIYNKDGHTIKIEGNTITSTATNIINNCENYTINATTKATITSPNTDINGKVNGTDDITTTGDVVAGTISLKTHLTTGVKKGNKLSGPPQ